MATWQVGQGSDDCARALFGDYWDLAASMCCASYISSSIYQAGSGMRFTNITIPKDTIITGAYLRFHAFQDGTKTVANTRISAEAVDNAVTFADDKAAFDARWANRTTARVDWDGISAWSINQNYNSPEIKTVIQEIVDRAGWESGNSIVIFWEDFENRSVPVYDPTKRYASSYDRSPADAPELVITYIEIVAPTVVTNPVTEVEEETAIDNGNITDNGGEDCDKRGFVYNASPHEDPGDTAPADSEYSNYVEETGSFGTGAFTGALTNLEPKTTYYVRAYAHNSAGYSYGSEVSFTTLKKIKGNPNIDQLIYQHVERMGR